MDKKTTVYSSDNKLFYWHYLQIVSLQIGLILMKLTNWTCSMTSWVSSLVKFLNKFDSNKFDQASKRSWSRKHAWGSDLIKHARHDYWTAYFYFILWRLMFKRKKSRCNELWRTGVILVSLAYFPGVWIVSFMYDIWASVSQATAVRTILQSALQN